MQIIYMDIWDPDDNNNKHSMHFYARSDESALMLETLLWRTTDRPHFSTHVMAVWGDNKSRQLRQARVYEPDEGSYKERLRHFNKYGLFRINVSVLNVDTNDNTKFSMYFKNADDCDIAHILLRRSGSPEIRIRLSMDQRIVSSNEWVERTPAGFIAHPIAQLYSGLRNEDRIRVKSILEEIALRHK